MQAFTKALEIESVDLRVDPVDIYQDGNSLRRITLRTRLTPQTETMTSEVVNEIVDTAARTVAGQLGAMII